MVIEPTELHTDRLLLRPFQSDDADALFAIYGDADVAYFALPAPVTLRDVEQSLAVNMQTRWSDRPYFAVIFAGEVVGDIVLQMDHPNRTANLGYTITRKHWGKGFATEAVRAVVDYAFRTFDLAKVYARADPRNIGSVRVMEKLGMQREGLLRSHVLRRGERADRVYYGLLRAEWEAATGFPVDLGICA